MVHAHETRLPAPPPLSAAVSSRPQIPLTRCIPRHREFVTRRLAASRRKYQPARHSSFLRDDAFAAMTFAVLREKTALAYGTTKRIAGDINGYVYTIYVKGRTYSQYVSLDM